MLMNLNVGDIVTSTIEFEAFPLLSFNVMKKFKTNLPGPAELPGAILICKGDNGQILRISEQILNGMVKHRVEIRVDRSDIIALFPSIHSDLKNKKIIKLDTSVTIPKQLEPWVSDEYSMINFDSAEGFAFDASKNPEPKNTKGLISVTSFSRANPSRTHSLISEYVNGEWTFYLGVFVPDSWVSMDF